MRYATPPHGTFKGRNIMTPTIHGYYKLADGSYAELAEGTGIYHEPIFGVSIRPPGMSDARDTRGKMFHSRKAAEDYIEELS